MGRKQKAIVYKLITVFILHSFFASGQKRIPESVSLNIDEFRNIDSLRIWNLYPMDSDHIYVIRIFVDNSMYSVQDKRMFRKMIHMANSQRPKGLHLLFVKRALYPSYRAKNEKKDGINQLEIKKYDIEYFFDSYPPWTSKEKER
ncbi:hypothetical protein [Chitinophaga pinensis]|uniref:Uncharacterized protein n=1 Tax=Chitinophaga pinensis TaxID=79329 RepID=A0A5C6M373_9BACT|nr:hypothetical protein [Chitinophaga pinensis]TWW02206.1 hypothetical protein FEF09_03415 [Chitinophaga pinensis]